MKPQTAALAVLLTGIGGAGAVALTTETASASASASVQRHGSSVHTVALTLRYADAATHFVGKDADHPAIGDEFIDTAPLRSNGKVVGHATNICTQVAGASEATAITQCLATFTLRRGEIVTAGADNSSNRTTDAVTGGTGTFAHASGTATTVSGSDAARITIRYTTRH
jgi:hypothetical protein